MRIYHFSRILALPFATVFGFLIYQAFTDVYFDKSLWLIPLGLILVTIYVLSPQLDHWWQVKHPIGLDQELIDLLVEHNPIYKELSPNSKEKFNNRTSLFMHGKDFFAMGSEKQRVPYDIKALISQIPVHISLGQEEFMFGDYDRIVLYKHPFPSPQFPFLHAMETHAEDGVIIMSLQHLEAAIREPDKYYHIGYHCFVEAFIKLNPAIEWPDIGDLKWEDLEEISNFPTQALSKSLGFKFLDPFLVLLVYYFVFPRKFLEKRPVLKKSLDQIFYPLLLV